MLKLSSLRLNEAKAFYKLDRTVIYSNLQVGDKCNLNFSHLLSGIFLL